MKKLSYQTLDRLPVGGSGIVLSLPENPELRRRLTALGLIPGTEIFAVNKSPFGDPRAYFFRSTLIALRQKDARTLRLEVKD